MDHGISLDGIFVLFICSVIGGRESFEYVLSIWMRANDGLRCRMAVYSLLLYGRFEIWTLGYF